MVKEFEDFKSLISDGKFFESHEVLESLWHQLKKSNHPDKNIIRGFINSAVSMELVKRGRLEPAKRVWTTYEKYKSLINDNPLYLDMVKFLDDKKPF